MKKNLMALALIATLSLGAYSCKPSDEKIQKEVETVLTTAQPGISVAVKDGVATLTGVVETDEAKAAAETAIKTVKGVKSIANNIVVTPPKVEINPDEVLGTTIATALTAGGFTGVTASAKDGKVTLTGEVKRADLQKVMQIANEAKPKKVINELKIK